MGTMIRAKMEKRRKETMIREKRWRENRKMGGWRNDYDEREDGGKKSGNSEDDKAQGKKDGLMEEKVEKERWKCGGMKEF